MIVGKIADNKFDEEMIDTGENDAEDGDATDSQKAAANDGGNDSDDFIPPERDDESSTMALKP